MPAALETFIDNGYADGQHAFGDMGNARTHIHNAGVQILWENWPEAATQMTGAHDDLGYFMKYLLQDSIWYHGLLRDWKDALYWINDNWPSGAAELTMGDILTAMLGASFEELTTFMGITQAYKVAVWDAPFNEEYYAALARGFKTWGT